MDVSEKVMKLERNLELPDFALSLQRSHYNVLSNKLLLIKPGWFAWEMISIVLEFE